MLHILSDLQSSFPAKRQKILLPLPAPSLRRLGSPALPACAGQENALRNAFLQAFLFGAQGFCFVYLPLLLCQQCHFLLECDFCRFLFRIKPLRSCPQPFTAYAERFLRQEQLFPCNLRLLGCPSQSRACRFLLRLFLLPFRLRDGIFRQRRLMGMLPLPSPPAMPPPTRGISSACPANPFPFWRYLFSVAEVFRCFR